MLIPIKNTKKVHLEGMLLFNSTAVTLQSHRVDFSKSPRCYGKHSVLIYVFTF